MKITKMDTRNLRNEEHFQFMTDVKNLIRSVGEEELNVADDFSQFAALYDKEDIALEAIRKSTLTDPIADADAERDSIYRGLVLLIQTYAYSTSPDRVKAARNMQIVIDHYGDFRSKPYNEETATIYNFLQDMNDRCAADIAALNAQEWITDLANANQKFSVLMNERFDEGAAKETVNLRNIRMEIDKVYNLMTDRVNASVLLNGKEAYADFVNKLNERIAYFKNTIAQRKGRVKAKKEKE